MKYFSRLIDSSSFKNMMSLGTMLFLINSYAFSQSHTFPVFSPGMFESNTTGVTTPMATGGLTGTYTLFNIKADYIGTTDAFSSWSADLEIEITDGTMATYIKKLRPTFGAKDDGSATVLHWTGILGKGYVGGDNLTLRIYSDHHDANGPYITTITNMEFTISAPGGGGSDVSITDGGATTVTGTHPSFTVSSTDTQLTEAQVDAFANNNGYALPSDIFWNAAGANINYMAGNVGIGTATPNNLFVLESGDTPSFTLSQNTSGGYPATTWTVAANESNYFISENQVTAPFLIEAGAPSGSLHISSNGNVGIGTQTPAFDLQVTGNVDVTGELTAASDIKLKKDILSIDNAMDKINKLNPVSYYYRADEFPTMNLAERRKMGLIAQEVQAILPNLVSAPSEITMMNGEVSEMLSVNYMEIVPLLIKGLQEQEIAIQKRDDQINLLLSKTEKISDLERELEELKALVLKAKI